MKIKKLAPMAVAVFLLIVITDYIIHGMIMKSSYQATGYLWRRKADMPGFMPYMFLGQAMIALFFSAVFIHGYKGKGIQEGVRYGILITGLMFGSNLIMYAVQPFGFGMIAAWTALGAVQAVLAGALCVKIHGKK